MNNSYHRGSDALDSIFQDDNEKVFHGDKDFLDDLADLTEDDHNDFGPDLFDKTTPEPSYGSTKRNHNAVVSTQSIGNNDDGDGVRFRGRAKRGTTLRLQSISDNTADDVFRRMTAMNDAIPTVAVQPQNFSSVRGSPLVSPAAKPHPKSAKMSAKVAHDPRAEAPATGAIKPETLFESFKPTQLATTGETGDAWQSTGSFRRGSKRGSQRRRLTVRQTEFMNRIMVGTTPHLEARKHILKEWTHARLLSKLTCTMLLSAGTVAAGYFTIPSTYGYVFVIAGLLCAFASFLGIRGSLRVANDIQFDDDGMKTVGQHELQTYFHVALGFVLVLCPLAVHVLMNIDLITGSNDINPDMLQLASLLSLANSALMIYSLRSVALIVTIWEISHSFLESVATTLALLGVLGVVLISSFLNYSSFLSTTSFNSPLGSSILAFLGVCVTLVASSMVGFGAAWYEARPMLLCHSIFTTLLIITIFTMGIYLMMIDVDQLIDGNCREIMQIMSYQWFDDVVGCTKYGGVNIGAKVEAFGAKNGFKYASVGVGESASCPSKESHASAWEYGLVTSNRSTRPVMLEGCLQLVCCNVLTDHITTHLSLLFDGFVLLIVTMMIVAYGDLWLRKHANDHNEKIKVMSRKRACFLLLIVLLGTLVAYGGTLLLVWQPQPTQVSALIIRDTLNLNVTTTGLPAEEPSTSCFNDQQDGNETGVDCGGPCDAACTAFSGCGDDLDCASGYCNSTTALCRAETAFERCSNGVRDGRETDVDCGGEMCASLHAETFGLDTLTDLERLYRCALGKSCSVKTDCLSGMCDNGVCIGCSDGLMNGDEGDVDCGSRTCVSQFATWYAGEDISELFVSEIDPALNDESDPDFGQLAAIVANYTTRDSRGLCLDGRTCTRPDQCASGVCVDGMCASCVNGIRDGDETDIDCGGRVCMARCKVAQSCTSPFDCASGSCSSNCASGSCPVEPGVCLRGPLGTPEEGLTLSGVLAGCRDGSKNGKETDTDCGGSHCAAVDISCAEGKGCFENNDCQSGLCDDVSLTCSSCFNSEIDGSETDVDCGGSQCAQRCRPEEKCALDSDCMSDLFCWTEDHIKITTQSIESEEVPDDLLVDFNLPPANTCQVAAEVEARVRGYPQSMDFETIDYESLFDTTVSDSQELVGSPIGDTGEVVRRRLHSSRLPRWPGFIGNLATGLWPFCCPLQLTSTVSVGSVFEVIDNKGISILLDQGDTVMKFKRGVLSRSPEVLIRPKQCESLNSISITTRVYLPVYCRFVRLTTSLMFNLVMPLRSMIVGEIKNASCLGENRINPLRSVDACTTAGISGAVIRVAGIRDGECVTNVAGIAVNPSCSSSCEVEGSTNYSTCVSRAPCCEWQSSTKYFRCFGSGLSDTSIKATTDADGRFTAVWPQFDPTNDDKPYHAVAHVFADGFISTTVEVTATANTKLTLKEPVYMIAQPPQVCSCDVFMSGANNEMDSLCKIYDTLDDLVRCHAVPTTGGCASADVTWALCDNTLTFSPTTLPSRAPTNQPSAQPTSANPTKTPTAAPSLSPSKIPTRMPTSSPSLSPSVSPSQGPTKIPNKSPSVTPSVSPSNQPSVRPTEHPSISPSLTPSVSPSNQPSVQPSVQPSISPSLAPSASPTNQPSVQPSAQPSISPSLTPSVSPSNQPSVRPSAQPSISPSLTPSASPSNQPSVRPSAQPSISPSLTPSVSPSNQPTTPDPTKYPTKNPTTQAPTRNPVANPTESPSVSPSNSPSTQSPSESPSLSPSKSPSTSPSSSPSQSPSQVPSTLPSVSPSVVPSTSPSVSPSVQPSTSPSVSPSMVPTNKPSAVPSPQPSLSPSYSPSSVPTNQPSAQPTQSPTFSPTIAPEPALTLDLPFGGIQADGLRSGAAVTWDAMKIEGDIIVTLIDATVMDSTAQPGGSMTEFTTEGSFVVEQTCRFPGLPAGASGTEVLDSINQNTSTVTTDPMSPDYPFHLFIMAFINVRCEFLLAGCSSGSCTVSSVIATGANGAGPTDVVLVIEIPLSCGTLLGVGTEPSDASFASQVTAQGANSTWTNDELGNSGSTVVVVDDSKTQVSLRIEITPVTPEVYGPEIELIIGRLEESTVKKRAIDRLGMPSESWFIQGCNTHACKGNGICSTQTQLCTCADGWDGYQCSVVVPTRTPTQVPTTVPTETDVCDGEWIKVFEQLDPCNVVLDLGERQVNSLFRDRFRYDIEGVTYAYYLRKSVIPDGFSIYKQMINWTDTNNVLNTDFELYSSAGELDTASNKWQFCNYNDPNVGFPRDCGRTEAVNFKWGGAYCLNYWSAAPSFAFHVCAASALPTRTPTHAPVIIVPTFSVNGSVFDAETKVGVPARVLMFKGVFNQIEKSSVPIHELMTGLTFGDAPAVDLVAMSLQSECDADADSQTSLQITESVFQFDDVPEGVYTIMVSDELNSTAMEEDLEARGLSQNYFQTKLTTVYVSKDVLPVPIAVGSTLAPSQLRIVLEYSSVPDMDLVVTFKVSDSSEEECIISGGSVKDNPCGCGDAVVTRDDTELDSDGIGRDIITLNRIHQTVYRFTLTRVTSIKADYQETNWRTDGRCGSLYPLSNGEASRCPVDSIIWDDDTIGARPCCSDAGYCGDTEQHCVCRRCVDYRDFVNDEWQTDYRADGRCRNLYHKAPDGDTAHCPTTPVTWASGNGDQTRPCCSRGGKCGATVQHCNCDQCLDYRKFAEAEVSPVETAATDSEIPTEISRAVVKVYNADGLVKEFNLPSQPYGSENYFDGHLYDGTASKSAKYARLFCINGKSLATGLPPQLHAYPAPQFFQWEGQMLDMDADNCPGTNDCDYVDAVGFTVNSELNGRYLKRYSRQSPFQAFPGYAISTRCRVRLHSPDNPSTLLPSVLREVTDVNYCLDICVASGSECEGVYWWEGIKSSDQAIHNWCIFYNNNHLCGGMFTSGVTRFVYEKVQVLATSQAWYTKLDTMFGEQGENSNHEIHLYRVAGDSGTTFEWYFDHDLRPTNGYLGLGVDATPQNSGIPDGVTLWATNIGGIDTLGAQAAVEDSRQVSFSKFSQACAHGANAPTLQSAFQAVKCICGPRVSSECSAAGGCAMFPIRYENTDICLGRVQYYVVLQLCDPQDPFQLWSVSTEGVLYGVGVPVGQVLGGNPDATRVFAVKIPSNPFDAGFLALEPADFGVLEPLEMVASTDGTIGKLNGAATATVSAPQCLYQPPMVGWRTRFVAEDSGVPCATFQLY